jgi:penicillin-binding protein 1C
VPTQTGLAPRRFARRLGGWAAAPLLLALALWQVFPFPVERLRQFPGGQVLVDQAGEPLRVTLGPGDVDCRPFYGVREGDWIAAALVAAEDQRFHQHPGLDPFALARAAFQNVTTGRRISGASTLSTQVIRLLDQRPRTWWSKLVEAGRALQMERCLSKPELLAQYLNRAPFGGNLVGIEAASRRYFGKDAHALSLSEAALLAGLPQSPSRLRPDRHPARARARQRYVLDRMVACGFITDTQRREAVAQRVAVRAVDYPMRAPHFAEVALAQLGPAAPGVQRTTLDPTWQAAAESALRRHVAGLRDHGVSGGAVVVIDVARGAVCALAGSPDYFAPGAGQVNAALAPRSAGSTLKPFIYALALDGGLITPGRVLPDVPMNFADYRPENFDRTFRGLVPAREALVLSLNLPLVELTRQMGVPRLHAAFRELGLGTLGQPSAHYGLGLAVGNAEVRLLDLANAYATLARGGEMRSLRVLEGAAEAARRICSPDAAWLVADALSDAERTTESTGHRGDVRLPRVAWKTGTSTGLRDAWTVAYNPDYVVAVWLGNPDGQASPALVGGPAAAPVAWELFRWRYPAGEGPWFARPAGVQRRATCAVSGCVPGPHCGAPVDDWCLAGTSSPRPCEVHRAEGRTQWPAEVEEFLARQRGDQPPAVAAADPVILSPAPGSSYRLLDGWAGESQAVALQAAAPESVYWFVNNQCLGRTGPGESLAWPLVRGRHRVVCSADSGRSAVSEIRVE